MRKTPQSWWKSWWPCSAKEADSWRRPFPMTNLTRCRTPASDSTSKNFFLICSASTLKHVGNILALWWNHTLFFPQRVWKQRESGGPRSGHAASDARPAALLCNCLFFKPSNVFLAHCYCRGWILSHCLFLSHWQDCYIVDQRGSSVMVWKGKQASKEERREALNRAVVSLLNNGLIIWLD